MSDNRWHVPMTTDIENLEEFGNDKAAFGELDGDHPPVAERQEDEVGTPTLEETLDFYDQHQPESIQITNPENN